MNKSRDVIAKVESSANPPWVITAALAIFLAAVAAVIALG